MTDQPFTPRLDSGERLSLKLGANDQQRMDQFDRSLGYRGIVTDQTTGTRYEIYGAACDLPFCVCDAVAYPLGDAGGQPDRADKLRLRTIEARRVELYTELEDTHDLTHAHRRRITIELDNLAVDERRIRGVAA